MRPSVHVLQQQVGQLVRRAALDVVPPVAGAEIDAEHIDGLGTARVRVVCRGVGGHRDGLVREDEGGDRSLRRGEARRAPRGPGAVLSGHALEAVRRGDQERDGAAKSGEAIGSTVGSLVHLLPPVKERVARERLKGRR